MAHLKSRRRTCPYPSCNLLSVMLGGHFCNRYGPAEYRSRLTVEELNLFTLPPTPGSSRIGTAADGMIRPTGVLSWHSPRSFGPAAVGESAPPCEVPLSSDLCASSTASTLAGRPEGSGLRIRPRPATISLTVVD